MLRGDLLRTRPDPDIHGAAATYERAVALAEQLGTRMTQLQALTRLAVLARGTSSEPAAHTALRQVLDSFTEGFRAPPLVDARRVIDDRKEAVGG